MAVSVIPAPIVQITEHECLNQAITTRGDNGVYYGHKQITPLSGYKAISASIYQWSGLAANVVAYIAANDLLAFDSDVSQTPSKMKVRVLWIKT